jgi:hypothetical protein
LTYWVRKYRHESEGENGGFVALVTDSGGRVAEIRCGNGVRIRLDGFVSCWDK